MSAEPHESPSPSEYRASHPYTPPPREYKPPSMLAEYKYLALAFAAILAGFVAFGWHVMRQAPVRPAAAAKPAAIAGRTSGAAQSQSRRAAPQEPASAAAPIYIEALPDPGSSR